MLLAFNLCLPLPLAPSRKGREDLEILRCGQNDAVKIPLNLPFSKGEVCFPLILTLSPGGGSLFFQGFVRYAEAFDYVIEIGSPYSEIIDR